MAKIAHLDYDFSEVFGGEISPVEGKSLEEKGTKRRKRKGKNNKEYKKSEDVHVHVGRFLVSKF